jgi:hypothetical protein
LEFDMSGLAVGLCSMLQHLDCSVRERSTKNELGGSVPDALLEQRVVARVSLTGKAEQYQTDSVDAHNLVVLDNRQFVVDVQSQQRNELDAWPHHEA